MNKPTARSIQAVVLTAATPLLGLATAAPANAVPTPLTWTFDKCAATPGMWQGNVITPQGGIEPLRTVLTDVSVSGKVLHVGFNWEVGDDFVAHLTGTLNQNTGNVVMNGRVIEGAHAGSRVHEEGHLYDAAGSCFTGTVRVMPAS